MILKALEAITIEDIKGLIDSKIPEGRQIEYKVSLPDGSIDSKKEFLADVSSFANCEGGDLILGVGETDGIPTEIVEINLEDPDGTVLRLENVIRDGISQRISPRIRVVGTEGKYVVVIRTSKSWNGPHRVVFNGHDKFYSRNSRGKYPLDVEELRYMFTSAQNTVQETGNFVLRRIDEILEDTTFVHLGSGAKLVLHLIPLDAFRPGVDRDVLSVSKEHLAPVYCLGSEEQINLEGHLSHCTSGGGDYLSYVQIFRNGSIESVSRPVLMNMFNYSTEIVGMFIESQLIENLPKYLQAYVKLGIPAPIAIGLSFVGIRGSVFAVYNQSRRVRVSKPFGKDVLRLPLQIVSDLNQAPEQMLRSTFDLMWNAFGYRKSMSYDDNGKWSSETLFGAFP